MPVPDLSTLQSEVQEIEGRVRHVELVSVETKGRVDAMSQKIEESIHNIGRNADKLDALIASQSRSNQEISLLRGEQTGAARSTNILVAVVGLGLAVLTFVLSIYH